MNQYLASNNLQISQVPLGVLIDIGFKLSGKLVYLAESLINRDPYMLNAVRDYSNPRGTIELSMRYWEGLSVLTPRVYIQTFDENGEIRDANGYEVMEFINDEFGQQLIKDFAEQVPVMSDGRTYKLNIVTKLIEVT